MRLTEKMLGNDSEWVDEDNIIQFIYYQFERELFSNEHPDDMPVATPETLEEARSIIESKGYTIS